MEGLKNNGQDFVSDCKAHSNDRTVEGFENYGRHDEILITYLMWLFCQKFKI
jgi:hypothetical protein